MLDAWRYIARALWPLVPALLLSACAYRGQVPAGPLEPISELYSRNFAVCIPTLIGNFVGWAPSMGVASPFWLAVRPFSERGADGVATALVIGPTLLGGFVVGTPFLPFSYFFDETPCILDL